MLVTSHVKTANRLRGILMPKRPRNSRSYLRICSTQDQHQPLPSSDVPKDQGDSTTASSTPTTVVTIHPSPTLFTGSSTLPSSQILDMLRRSVPRTWRDMDAVFIANGLAKAEKAYRSAKVEEDEAQGTTMELVASKVLPYDMEATRRIVWRHFNDFLPQMPDRRFFQYRDDREVRGACFTVVRLTS